MKKAKDNGCLHPKDDDPPPMKSFTSMFQQNRERYRNFLRERFVPEGVEDDIIQDSCYVMLKKIKAGIVIENMEKFFWGILWNTMKDFHSKRWYKPKRDTDKLDKDIEEMIQISTVSENGMLRTISLDTMLLSKTRKAIDETNNSELPAYKVRMARKVRKCIDELKPKKKELLKDDLFGGFTKQELAEIHGMTLNNTKTNLSRIKKKIREEVLKDM